MCGIAGFWHPTADYDRASVAQYMHQVMVHRGPDDHGVLSIEAIGLTLIHRRLSIVDLSPAGHQPMHSPSLRYTIVFNGEIYNHLELRKELEFAFGVQYWRGHSDTETLLIAFEHWGIDVTLSKLVGMFAIALYDANNRVLTLIRDRVGEKPLYYGWQKEALVFGSDLIALKQHPNFEGRINRDVLALYLRHNVVPSPYSIYENIYKLDAGCCIHFDLTQHHSQLSHASQQTYWSFSQLAHTQESRLFTGTEEEATDELEKLLLQAVKGQMQADVPLGAFLSGGIDSSTIVSLMQSQSTKPIKTFTIGFDDTGYNEAHHAKAISDHLGTDHTEWYLTPQDARSIIPELPKIWSEPFADSSQIPMLLVSRLAKQHVTVALSGDAGDELFAGYNRHQQLPALWRKLGNKPYWLRSALSALLSAPGADTWDKMYQIIKPILPRHLQHKMPGYKLDKLATILAAKNEKDLYKRTVSHQLNPASLVLNSHEAQSKLDSTQLNTMDFLHWIMALDSMTYLSDDILTKVDRASMAVSLESRVPFLDHRVIEFAWSLPSHFKQNAGSGKQVLRRVLDRYVPRAMIDRPKQGFGLPVGDWLRNELKSWADDLLSPEKIRQQGVFDAHWVQKMWQEHCHNKRNWQFQLWDVLMFQAWLEEQR
jgi:asparagine synthase (glutamine-hydrolysing)